MKYFTLDWWYGSHNDDDNSVPVEYSRHLDTIRTRLPVDLLALQESISLHDSHLRQLIIEIGAATACIVLESDTGEERFTLTYTGLQRFESTVVDIGVSDPYAYGDLGYDEVDVLPTGEFEHRLLFSTGIELALVFHGFQLARKRQADG